MTASPKKLRNGSWGAITDGTAKQGATITITTRSGKSWTATVARVIWTGDGKSIVATTKTGYTPAIRDSRGYVRERGHYDGYCGYPCPVTGKKCCPANGPCHDCE